MRLENEILWNKTFDKDYVEKVLSNDYRENSVGSTNSIAFDCKERDGKALNKMLRNYTKWLRNPTAAKSTAGGGAQENKPYDHLEELLRKLKEAPLQPEDSNNEIEFKPYTPDPELERKKKELMERFEKRKSKMEQMDLDEKKKQEELNDPFLKAQRLLEKNTKVEVRSVMNRSIGNGDSNDDNINKSMDMKIHINTEVKSTLNIPRTKNENSLSKITQNTSGFKPQGKTNDKERTSARNIILPTETPKLSLPSSNKGSEKNLPVPNLFDKPPVDTGMRKSQRDNNLKITINAPPDKVQVPIKQLTKIDESLQESNRKSNQEETSTAVKNPGLNIPTKDINLPELRTEEMNEKPTVANKEAKERLIKVKVKEPLKQTPNLPPSNSNDPEVNHSKIQITQQKKQVYKEKEDIVQNKSKTSLDQKDNDIGKETQAQNISSTNQDSTRVQQYRISSKRTDKYQKRTVEQSLVVTGNRTQQGFGVKSYLEDSYPLPQPRYNIIANNGNQTSNEFQLQKGSTGVLLPIQTEIKPKIISLKVDQGAGRMRENIMRNTNTVSFMPARKIDGISPSKRHQNQRNTIPNSLDKSLPTQTAINVKGSTLSNFNSLKIISSPSNNNNHKNINRNPAAPNNIFEFTPTVQNTNNNTIQIASNLDLNIRSRMNKNIGVKFGLPSSHYARSYKNFPNQTHQNVAPSNPIIHDVFNHRMNNLNNNLVYQNNTIPNQGGSPYNMMIGGYQIDKSRIDNNNDQANNSQTVKRSLTTDRRDGKQVVGLKKQSHHQKKNNNHRATPDSKSNRMDDIVLSKFTYHK